MSCPSLEQVLTLIDEDGIDIEQQAEAAEAWVNLYVEGPEPKLSRSFSGHYESKNGVLTLWTELRPRCPEEKLSKNFCLALLRFNHKLQGAVFAEEDGSIHYRAPAWPLRKPEDYRPPVATALTEAGLAEETLKQMEQADEDPLTIVQRMPSHSEWLHNLRKAKSSEEE